MGLRFPQWEEAMFRVVEKHRECMLQCIQQKGYSVLNNSTTCDAALSEIFSVVVLCGRLKWLHIRFYCMWNISHCKLTYFKHIEHCTLCHFWGGCDRLWCCLWHKCLYDIKKLTVVCSPHSGFEQHCSCYSESPHRGAWHEFHSAAGSTVVSEDA